MTEGERDDIKSKCYGALNDKLANMTLYSPPPTNLQGRWGDLAEPQSRVSTWDTGVPVPLLQFVGAKSVDIPEQTQLHSHLAKTHAQVRLRRPSYMIAVLLAAVVAAAGAASMKEKTSLVVLGSFEQTGGGH